MSAATSIRRTPFRRLWGISLPPDVTADLVVERMIAGLTAGVAILAIVLGILLLMTNALERLAVPILGAAGVLLFYLLFYAERVTGRWNGHLILLSLLSVVATLIIALLPLYVTNLGLHAVIHRSIFDALFLIGLGIPAAGFGLYFVLGAKPSAEDVARYPLLIVPIVIPLFGYALIIVQLLLTGLSQLTFDVLTRPYLYVSSTSTVFGDDGWPTFVDNTVQQAGMSQYILGTLLLMLLTSFISLPIGVGTGIYLSEYAGRSLAQVISFSTSALRAVSVLILAISAFNLYRGLRGTFLSDIFAGYYYDVHGIKHVASGSYVTAAVALSLLVIPVIARATLEGCRSLPPELREGSHALGAPEAYTLLHVVFPWSLPNIVTGLLLGCAEAAGSVAVILFIAGSGVEGFGIFNHVTSLSYLIFGAEYSSSGPFRTAMQPYQYSAGLILLVLTLGLTAGGLVLKRRFALLYRGTTGD